ncbi:NUDIX hydrolase [Paludibacterium paludis]|uniref:DNA mismatch repair protein MutT n=1 Tax=Paludibacterium paludis TaxID=1225769 RepID=A0A918P490_9NEIS|nr:NUDIX hydrolase [Paludibacterium paludis]GGY18386.1 DNA mismatch repair protein MutT [Paludibacterium paludis]
MRQRIRQEIARIVPLDLPERADIAQALAWIDSGAPLCRTEKPATPPTHLVAYFALVDSGHILLVDHKNARLWLPPGGHVDPDEHPRETVRRELQEELGVRADQPVGPPVMISIADTVGLTAGHTDVSLWYVVKTRRDIPLTPCEEEFNEIRWFGFHEVPLQNSDPHMARFLAKLAGSAI